MCYANKTSRKAEYRNLITFQRHVISFFRLFSCYLFFISSTFKLFATAGLLPHCDFPDFNIFFLLFNFSHFTCMGDL